MNKHERLKKDFKRLYEYTTYIVDDVDIPDFVQNTVTEDDVQQQSEVPTQQPAEQPVQQPPVSQEPVQPKQEIPAQPEQTPTYNQQKINPVDNSFEEKKEQEFKYTKIVNDLNSLNITVHNLNNKFDSVLSKMEYLTKTVDEVKEPSNEEKLLAMTRQSYPFNKSMLDVWGTQMNSQEEIINTEDGVIKKIGDEYQMDVKIDELPRQNNNLNHFGKF